MDIEIWVTRGGLTLFCVSRLAPWTDFAVVGLIWKLRYRAFEWNNFQNFLTSHKKVTAISVRRPFQKAPHLAPVLSNEFDFMWLKNGRNLEKTFLIFFSAQSMIRTRRIPEDMPLTPLLWAGYTITAMRKVKPPPSLPIFRYPCSYQTHLVNVFLHHF